MDTYAVIKDLRERLDQIEKHLGLKPQGYDRRASREAPEPNAAEEGNESEPLEGAATSYSGDNPEFEGEVELEEDDFDEVFEDINPEDLGEEHANPSEEA